MSVECVRGLKKENVQNRVYELDRKRYEEFG